MKVWTIQNKDVLDIINEDGEYHALTPKGRYYAKSREMSELYEYLLKCFNRVNKIRCLGIVFGFMKSEEERIIPIENIEEFKKFVKNKKRILKDFWNLIDKKQGVIIEMEFDNCFNPLFIDYNDWQFIMPPRKMGWPYTERSIERILNNLETGTISQSEFPSGVIQVHLPYISKENIINTYPLFEI